MSASIKDIKKRISSTKKTGQITKAMYMVSQSKVKRSEKTKDNYQSFLSNIKNLTKTALSKSPGYQNKMIEQKEEEKVVYLLVSSDTGLAGAYNNQIFRYFKDLVGEPNEKIYVGTIGRKAFNYANNSGYNMINKSAILIRDDVMFIDIVPITKAIINLFLSGEISHVYIIYNHYVNSLTCEVTKHQLLPITEIDGEEYGGEYIFENGLEECLDDLIKMYIESLIYGFILDAKTSEHSSRMNAMKNASDNVDEIVGKYELIYNRARQQAITNELIDIIAGSNAVNKDDDNKPEESIKQELYDTYQAKSKMKFVSIFSKDELNANDEKKILDILEKYYQGMRIRLIKKIDEKINKGFYLIVDNRRISFDLNNLVDNLKNSL